jgi:hypothetical protein
MSKPKLLIIECISRAERMNESLILYEFLKMSAPRRIHSVRLSSKDDVLAYLKTKANLAGYQYVHLSGHGDEKECGFETPRGDIAPEEFPRKCFDGKTVTVSACGLGKKEFIDPFLIRTAARFAIAPQREVQFIDAALWHTIFYYHALHIGNKPEVSYEKTQKSLYIKGAFQFWLASAG